MPSETQIKEGRPVSDLPLALGGHLELSYKGSVEDKWAHFKILTEFTLAIAALAWGILSWSLVRFHEHRASERQAQIAVEASRLQAKTSDAQLATSLISSIAKGTPKEREAALLILSSAAPNLANDISSVLERNASTPQEKQFAQEVSRLSIQAKSDQEFTQHLEQARVYQRFQLFGQADREYIRASDLIPARVKADTAKIKEAKSRYADQKFYEAAKIFEEAFRNASSA